MYKCLYVHTADHMSRKAPPYAAAEQPSVAFPVRKKKRTLKKKEENKKPKSTITRDAS